MDEISTEYQLPEHIVILSKSDLLGNIIEYNEGFKDASGYSDGELLGKPHSLLRHPDMPKEAFQDLWATISDRRPWSGVVKNRRKNGEYYWVTANVAPIIENNEVTSYVSVRYPATKEDISSAETLYREVNAGRMSFPFTKKPGKINQLVAVAVTALVLISIVFLAFSSTLNKEFLIALVLTGAASSSYMFYQLLTLLRPNDSQRKAIYALIDGQFKNRVEGDDPWSCTLNMMRLRIGESAARQYDAFKQAIELKDRAEHMAMDMTVDLRHKTEEALAAAKVKSEFLANMSHEIRTPINAVLGLSYLALKLDMSEQQKDFCNKIHSSAESLLNIVNNVLDFSKIESGHVLIESSPVSVEKIVHDSLSMITASGKAGHLVIHQQIDTRLIAGQYRLLGDEFRIGQVLINLLSNAVKFTHHGKIEVNVTLVQQDQQKSIVAFHIIDSGIGMTLAQQSKIFQAFSQADGSTTRKYGGTGLGLSISKQLAQLMGGDLTVTSQLGEGSCFTLTVPLQHTELEQSKVNHYAAIAEHRESFDGGALDYQIPSFIGKRVLLVEDNFINQQIAQGMLAETQIEIVTASNGREALDILTAGDQHFDLVLMDLQMPIMGGVETVERIRVMGQFTQLPIIAMTAHTFEEEKRRCFDVGMNDHLPKPLLPHQLHDMLSKWLPKSSTTETENVSPQQDIASQPRVQSNRELLEQIPNLDLSVAMITVQKVEANLVKLLLSTYQEYQHLPNQIKEMIAHGKVEDAITLLHTAKSIFGYFGMKPFAQIFSEAEKALKNNELQDSLFSAEFESKFEATMQAIALLKMNVA